MTRTLTILALLLPILAFGQGVAVVDTVDRGGSPGGWLSTNGLVAWYDFNDATDSYGDYDLTEQDGPTYAREGNTYYGIASDTTDAQWYNTSIDSVIGNVSGQDITFVFRTRWYGSMTSGDYFWRMNNAANHFRLSITNPRGAAGDYSAVTINQGMVSNQWHTFFLTSDWSEETTTLWMDNTYSTNNATSARDTSAGDLSIGSTFYTLPGEDMEIDYWAVFERILTSAERTAIYNGGGTFEFRKTTPPETQPWKPSDIATCEINYRADGWVLEAADDPCEDGDSVVTLTDHSGNDNHGFVYDTVWHANRGGLPALEMGGAIRSNIVATTTVTDSACTAFYVFETTDTIWITSSEFNSSSPAFGYAQTGSASSADAGAGTPDYYTNNVAIGDTRDDIYDAVATGDTVIFIATDVDMSGFINGINVLGYYTTTGTFTGYLREYILYSSTLSDADRKRVYQYLQRWQ